MSFENNQCSNYSRQLFLDKGKAVYKESQYSVSGIATLQYDVFWVKEHSNTLFWSNKTHSLDNANVKQYTIGKCIYRGNLKFY